jgi:hypothetical protein
MFKSALGKCRLEVCLESIIWHYRNWGHKIQPVQAEFIHAVRQMDMAKLICAFCDYVYGLKIAIVYSAANTPTSNWSFSLGSWFSSQNGWHFLKMSVALQFPVPLCARALMMQFKEFVSGLWTDTMMWNFTEGKLRNYTEHCYSDLKWALPKNWTFIYVYMGGQK